MSAGPLASAKFMKPSPLASSVMTTLGASLLLGMLVSMVRSTWVAEVLPAVSLAVTLILAAPSGSGCCGVTDQRPLRAVVVLRISPVGRLTVMLAPASDVPLMVGVLSLVMPSPGTPLSDAGSRRAVTAGGRVSIRALLLPMLPRLPAVSRIWAVTVRVVPSPGLAMPGRAKLLLVMSASVRVMLAWVTPFMVLMVVIRVLPAVASLGRAMLTSISP